MIKVRMMKFIAIITAVASLFGCTKPGPHILDGPGMMYIDSEYRNQYANCLPFAEIQGAPYFAIAYLGNGETGRTNKDIYTKKLFESLGEDKINSIPCFEFDGDDWFLVVPRYKDEVTLIKDGEEVENNIYETALIVKCNSDIVVEAFNVSDKKYTLAIDENGNLKDANQNVWKSDDTSWDDEHFVWDITHLDSENNTNNK